MFGWKFVGLKEAVDRVEMEIINSEGKEDEDYESVRGRLRWWKELVGKVIGVRVEREDLCVPCSTFSLSWSGVTFIYEYNAMLISDTEV